MNGSNSGHDTSSLLVRLTNIYTGFMLSGFILWPGMDGYVSIQQAKIGLFKSLTCGYFLILILLTAELLLIGRLKLQQMRSRKTTWTQRFVFLYWLISVVSTLLSEYRNEALLGMSRDEGLLTITLYCVAFLCVSVLAKPGQWLGWLLCGTMAIFDGVCLLQIAKQNPFGLFPAGMNYYDANKLFSGVYLGTTGNAGLTAALLCLTLPLLLGFAWKAKTPFCRIAILPAALNLVVLYLSRIQAGLLGVALGMLLALPVVLGHGKYRRWALIFAVGVLLCVFVMILFFPGESGLAYEIHQILQGNFDPDFGNGRIHIWREVLRRVPDNPWFGTGPDTMQAYDVPGLSWTHANSGAEVPLMIDIAHNEYLNILFHQGIFALAAYLAALETTAGKWIQNRRPVAAVLGTSVLCYSIQAFFSIGMSAASGPFWVVWALLESELQKMEV